MFAMSKQVESHAKRLATLAGRQDLPWQPILESSLTERGRGSAPGSSGNDRTCAALRCWPAISRTELVLPRTVACGSVNGIEWTLSGRSAAGLALVFFSEQVHAGLCEWL